ncbi:putative YMC1-protein of the mitochondrial carrier family [Acaromyces ingoldii]|uniref:Putative YMC1-protein of the mitochondrial carrier family n=1 Tax=Acaromyces ingoldii TaxID=215250 RepID=A0A316YHI7_9BASI|nr:putative YMC1-protein of the mitochondrial carrier family [Acaromyces ingoldii]PWN88659.1 putative YMC1-protein of the mitochondrial carrier family [Acaromyces ingoldii]
MTKISRTTKDVASGTAGGIAQVLVGQPLDILKVRLQTAAPGTYKGLGDCASQIVKREGLLGFYKGTLTPLLGVGVCVSIQFGVVEAVKRRFNAENAKVARTDLSKGQLYASGALAGLANSIVAGPVEQIRIRLQTQQTRLYAGPLDCASQIVRQSGPAGLLRGMLPTMLRESQGMGVYFLSYEFLVQRHLAETGKQRADLPSVMAMLFGASAGVALWLSAYPLDVIKSRMQTDAISPSERRYKGFLDCASDIYRSAGPRGFVKGLAPTLVRAPFANAATFVVYEWASRQLEPHVK